MARKEETLSGPLNDVLNAKAKLQAEARERYSKQQELTARVKEKLSATDAELAHAAWRRVWDARRNRSDLERARVAMLRALDEGQGIAQAEEVARQELAKVGFLADPFACHTRGRR